MKVYRVSYCTQSESSEGYDFFSNKRDAEKALKLFKEQCGNDFDDQSSRIDCDLEIKLNKKDVLAFLNAWASHPNNG